MRFIGAHLDSSSIQLCLLSHKRGKSEIVALKSSSFNDLSDVKQLYKWGKNIPIASPLPVNHFLIKTLDLPNVKGKYLEKTILFQAETASHLRPEDVIILAFQTRKKETSVVLATKEGIGSLLSKLSQIEIEPDVVNITASSLYHFVKWKVPDLNHFFILDIGSELTTCVWVEESVIKKVHYIPIGTEILVEALFNDRKKVLLRKEIESAAKQLDLLLLKNGLNPHLALALQELQQEIQRIFYSFTGEEKRPVIVTGKLDVFIHLKEFLIGETKPILTKEEELFAIAIGSALEQTKDQPIQLRRAEFFPKKNWNKLGKYAFLLFLFSTLISSCLVAFTLWNSYVKKQNLASQIPLEIQGNIEERIDRWIGSIESNHKEYPYILQAYSVSEALSWLSSHPVLQQAEQEGDPITFKDIQYKLVKFPRIGASKEPYLVKMTLQFSFKNEMNARKLHESLRQGDFHVDPSKEVSWEVFSDSYRVSFFLKNRGPYVF
jgi:hypothetical protein